MYKTIANTSFGTTTTLTLPTSSTDGEIAVFSGSAGNVLTGGHGVTISSLGNINGANSLIMDTNASNPGSATTLWLNSADGNKLYRGSTLVEGGGGGGSGDVSGVAPTVVNGMCVFDDTTGTTIKGVANKLTPLGNAGLRITGDNTGDANLIYIDDNVANVGMGRDVFDSILLVNRMLLLVIIACHH